MKPRRQGTTLVEIIVVIAILGFFTVFAMAKWPAQSHRAKDVVREVEDVRAQAIRTFRTATIWIALPDTSFAVTALANGTVIGIDAHGLNRLRGRINENPFGASMQNESNHANQ